MANQGAKKRRDENIRHMRNLLRLIIASNAIYVVIRMGVFYSSFTWKHLAGLILTSLAYVIPYQQLAAMAKPAYTDNGELLDGGFDMSTGGICGYVYFTDDYVLLSEISFHEDGYDLTRIQIFFAGTYMISSTLHVSSNSVPSFLKSSGTYTWW
ncbi:hypothetical protein BUALT_Bualt16G0094500 [Buddleja alternifolia]|uniref:Transmembrane protein 208 n=1 Tax=Buddleja alternifolia TaxID=168488 RepID=A0AAV6WKY9_9LAMI|nr:hypothetical protein BUALT_Bualt16G0094500 [Buddleja alternifolia]